MPFFPLRARALSAYACACALLTSVGSLHAQPAPATAPVPQLTKPPRLIEFVEAEYPAAERGRTAEATVVLELSISSTGSVENPVIRTSAGADFDAAALQAVSRFRFEPAEIDGKPAPVRITYAYRFKLEPVAAPAPLLVRVSGQVVRKSTGEPLAGVEVSLDGSAKAVTDASGSFAFEAIAPGLHELQFARADLTTVRSEERVQAQAQKFRYELEPRSTLPDAAEQDDLEIVIRPPRMAQQTLSTAVFAGDARRVPGAQGDVLKVVENLPGVARASAGSGAVVVWGAAPEDTRTYIGAMHVPMLYHFGGLRAVTHPDTVRGVELLPGGYGAAYGRGLGGIVLVQRNDPATDAAHGSLQLDALDASARVTGPVTSRASVDLAGRRGHLADLAGILRDREFESFFAIPEYYDASARLRYQLEDGAELELGGLLSSDEQSRTHGAQNSNELTSDRRALSFERIHFRYQKAAAAGESIVVEPWFGFDRAERSAAYGRSEVETQTHTSVFGLRAEYRSVLNAYASALVGYDFELAAGSAIRRGTLTLPAREGDPFIFGRPPQDQTNFDDWHSSVASGAPFAEFDLTPLGDTFHVTPGLRVEPFWIHAERRRPQNPGRPDIGVDTFELTLQPRLGARLALGRRTTLKAAFGMYRQGAAAEDLSSVFGNPLLATARGFHYLAGASYELPARLVLETTVFHTRSEDLVVRNTSAAPEVAQALVQEGAGRSWGAQLMLRRERSQQDGFFGWAAYTLSRSERLDPSAQRWRLFDYDQTHVLTALAAYDLGRGWDVGARLRATSGYPRTPVRGAYYNSGENRYEPLLGVSNTERIPAFLQFDVRGSKRFDFGNDKLEIYVEVQNVTARSNPEEIVYSADYSSHQFITGLPILPVAGARFEF